MVLDYRKGRLAGQTMRRYHAMAMDLTARTLDDFLAQARLLYRGRAFESRLAKSSDQDPARAESLKALDLWAEAVRSVALPARIEVGGALDALMAEKGGANWYRVRASLEAVLNCLRKALQSMLEGRRESECRYLLGSMIGAVSDTPDAVHVATRALEEDLSASRQLLTRWLDWLEGRGLIREAGAYMGVGRLLEVTSDGVDWVEDARDDILYAAAVKPGRKLTLPAQDFNAVFRAVLGAFPDRRSLERTLRLSPETEINLNDIAADSNMQDVVFDVLRWFELQGRLSDLLAAVRRDNPGNQGVREVIELLRARGVVDLDDA